MRIPTGQVRYSLAHSFAGWCEVGAIAVASDGITQGQTQADSAGTARLPIRYTASMIAVSSTHLATFVMTIRGHRNVWSPAWAHDSARQSVMAGRPASLDADGCFGVRA